MKYLQYCFTMMLFLASCTTTTTTSTGPFVVAGPVNVSATVDNNGVVTLNGTYQQTLIGDQILGAGWQMGFQTTLNQAQQKKYTLFVLYQDDQGNVHQREYDINQPFEVDFTNEQWVQKIVHDGNGNIVVYVQTKVQPAVSSSSTISDSAPIFDHIDQHEEYTNSQLVIKDDVYFSDATGDAYAIEYDLRSVVPNISGVQVQNDSIDASSDQQRSGTYKTITWECGSNNKTYTVTLQAHILDRAGSQSSPFSVVFDCR